MEEHYIKDVGKITYVYDVNLEEHKMVIEKQQKRIAELEKDLEFTTKTANELIEIKHKLEQELAELKEKDNYHLRYELAGADETITNLKKQLEEKDKEIERLKERLSVFDNFKDNYGYTNYDDSEILEDLQSRAFQGEDDTAVVESLFDFFDICDENEILPKVEEISEKLKCAIVLPVKIGDTIYVVPSETNYRLNIVNGREEQNKVYEWTVSEIRYNKHGYSVVCDVGDAQFYCNYEPPKNLCGHFDTEKYYGETWFSTLEEAEKKLQELRNGDFSGE